MYGLIKKSKLSFQYISLDQLGLLHIFVKKGIRQLMIQRYDVTSDNTATMRPNYNCGSKIATGQSNANHTCGRVYYSGLVYI